MASNRCTSGFTLVELLTVISIVAVLAAILFPVFGRAKAAAKKTTCLSNVKQIGISIAIYATDHDDFFPACADSYDRYTDAWNGSEFETEVASFGQIQDVLRPYTKSEDIFQCPADAGTIVIDNGIPVDFETIPSLYKKYGSSYLWQTMVSVQHASNSSMPNPAAINLLFDASGSWHTSERLMQNSDVLTDFQEALRYNVVFADYHAKSVSYDDLRRASNQPLQ